jgi:hypothetical protein
VAEWSSRAVPVRDTAKRLLGADALSLVISESERSTRPVTRGLLGAATRGAQKFSDVASLARRLVSWTKVDGLLQAGSAQSSVTAAAVGRGIPPLLDDLIARFVRDAELARLPLGNVPAQWAAEKDRLVERLHYLVAESEALLHAADTRPSWRRRLGTAMIYGFETLIGLVLLITLWRLAHGFVTTQYVAGALISNAVALIIVLLVLGYFVGGMFFPPAARRLRQIIIAQAGQLIDETWSRLETALKHQVDASEQLERDGERLLSGIDGIVRAIASSTAAGDEVNRLFGDNPTVAVPAAHAAPVEPPIRQSRRVALD